MKDTRLVVYVKNNILISARERLGLNQRALAMKLGCSPSHLGDLENLKEYPLLQNGEWSKLAQKLSSFLGMTEEELFPEHFKDVKQSKITKEVEFSQLRIKEEFEDQRLLAMNPEHQLSTSQLKEQINLSLHNLEQKEREILNLRFGLDGEKSLDLETIGIMYGVQRERIRQIEANALRRLRHPANCKFLKSFL